jgi:hypothetical protein
VEKEEKRKKTTKSLSKIDPKMMERIQSLRLMDDDFMTIVFSGDNKLTEFLLRILLDRSDLTVKSCLTQKEKHNIFGRSVRLDIFAIDTNGMQYNIEIQRADKGASEKRARYNQAMIDSHTLKKNDDFSQLPETYIIFITENDFYGKGEPIYMVNQSITTRKGDVLPFDNGTHTIYVNGAYRGNDAIGHLMSDFCSSNADEMYYREIAERVRFHKQEEGGAITMCRAFEEYGNEVRNETRTSERLSFARDLIRQNKLSLEEISAVSHLPLEQVQEIAEQLLEK